MTRERVIIFCVLAVLALSVTGWHIWRNTTPAVRYYALVDGKEQPVSMSEAAKWPANKGELHVHWANTLAIWMGALLTLAVMSFLYRDNPVYRVAEHIFVGISAAYWMTQGFWTTIVPNLLGELFPRAMKFSMLPGIDLDKVIADNTTDSYFSGIINYAAAEEDGLNASWLQLMDPMYLGALVLGIMLLMRLAPKGQWIAVWPLAVVIGTTAGVRLIGYSGADFVKQIDATLVPLIVPVYTPDPATGLDTFHFGKTFHNSFSNIVLVTGVMCGLLYFFFSLEHKGAVGAASRIGIWVLMITFGGGFGYTVMGRITLLTARLKYLALDWLNLTGGT